MKILAFESSAKAAGAALLEDGILRAEAFQNSGMTHSCTLMKMAEDLLASSGVSPQEIDAAAVGNIFLHDKTFRRNFLNRFAGIFKVFYKINLFSERAEFLFYNHRKSRFLGGFFKKIKFRISDILKGFRRKQCFRHGNFMFFKTDGGFLLAVAYSYCFCPVKKTEARIFKPFGKENVFIPEMV